MVTKVLVSEGWQDSFLFRIAFDGKEELIVVSDFKDGIAKLGHMPGCDFFDLVKIIESFFKSSSNFEEEVQKCFISDDPLKKVEFDFNKNHYEFDKNSTSKDLIREFEEKTNG